LFATRKIVVYKNIQIENKKKQRLNLKLNSLYKQKILLNFLKKSNNILQQRKIII